MTSLPHVQAETAVYTEHTMVDAAENPPTNYEPIQRLEIEHYGCIQKTTFELTPLHALIGPNDSGKSTVLRALRTVTHLATSRFDSFRSPFEPSLGESSRIAVEFEDELGYAIQAKPNTALTEMVTQGQIAHTTWTRNLDQLGQVRFGENVALRNRLPSPVMVRFDPDNMRHPAPLIPDDQGIAFADERGQGLASVFDAIINRDVAAFIRIQDETKLLFPTVDKIGLSNTDNAHKVLAITLVDGTRVNAQSMSEGLLYYLAFSALRYIQGSRLFLVEEPENGLHPSRIADVVAVLREISKRSQVVIATHSPLVINELKGDEVTVLTRDANGTHAKLIKDTPNFDERSAVYALGELWVSYANGSDESPLLEGGART